MQCTYLSPHNIVLTYLRLDLMAGERELRPPSSLAVGSAPFSNKYFTVSAFPPKDAQCRGVIYKIGSSYNKNIPLPIPHSQVTHTSNPTMSPTRLKIPARLNNWGYDLIVPIGLTVHQSEWMKSLCTQSNFTWLSQQHHGNIDPCSMSKMNKQQVDGPFPIHPAKLQWGHWPQFVWQHHLQ